MSKNRVILNINRTGDEMVATNFGAEGIYLMVGEQTFGELVGMTKAVQEDIAKIEKTLNGNGQPGLLDRTTRNEDAIQLLTKNVQELSKNVADLKCAIELQTASISKLEATLTNHVSDNIHSPRGLLIKYWKEASIIGVVGFLLLHSMIPPTLTLWDIAAKWLGIK